MLLMDSKNSNYSFNHFIKNNKKNKSKSKIEKYDYDEEKILVGNKMISEEEFKSQILKSFMKTTNDDIIIDRKDPRYYG